MKQYPYTIKCKQCGKEWHYEQFTCYMQKINAFHCNCGGTLEVVKNSVNDTERGKTMERNVGTISRGIRCPIIREGDDLAKIVVDSVLTAGQTDGFELRDRDIICVTESVVARAQGNYASVDAIAADVKAKLGGETIGVIFPILSRNRFAICLKGIAQHCEGSEEDRPDAQLPER